MASLSLLIGLNLRLKHMEVAMTAQKETQSSTAQKTPQEEPKRQQTALARRNMLPALAPLLTNTFDLLNPLSLMRSLHEELNRVFSATGTGSSSGSAVSTPWIPPVEVAYKDGNYVASAELPGLTDEDVTVEIDDDAIVIHGERQIEHTETKGGMTRTERRYGEFYRAIPLPDGADAERARAEFKDGMLKVSVPFAQAKSNVRLIPIQTSASAQSTQPQPAASHSAEPAATSEAAKDRKAA
jgi:HSP20 family protein